ncbi:hypothetical protein VTN02DRAFT_1825 [Thermoascus thermophilus]
MSAGSFAGALAAGYLSDQLGRRTSLQIAAVIWIIGSVIQLSSQDVAQLICGRVISGLSVGIMSSQIPVYLAELSPARIRGRVVGIQQWAIEWGILIMYLVSYGCSKVEGPASFRIAWGVQAVPALILLGALLFFPESPRWLASKDRWEQCLNVLTLLHGYGEGDDRGREDPAVQAEYLEVQDAQRLADEGRNRSILGLFGRSMWRRTTAGLFAQLWQQLLGGSVMMYYLVYVFQMANLPGNVKLYSYSIHSVILLVTTGITLLFIEKTGRRNLFVVGGIIMAALHFAVAGLMASHGHHVDSIPGASNVKWQVTGPPAKGVIACIYLFVACYGFTWGPAAWVYCSEVFPIKWRAKGVGLCAAVNWMFNFALTYFVPPSFENIVWRTYIMFGIFCLASTVHSFLAFYETQGKTLEEIDGVFDSGLPAWRSGQIKSKFGEKVHRIEDKQEGIFQSDAADRLSAKEAFEQLDVRFRV